MDILHDSYFLDPAHKGAVLAIGNFDGVHLGHQAVLAQARALAQDLGAPLGVLTFDPHPREYFKPEAPAFRLMTAQTRAEHLAQNGVEKLFELPFNAAMAELSAEDFARVILAERLGAVHVVVGDDFRCGAGRTGDAAQLRAFGEIYGFGVTLAQEVTFEGIELSSTAIRLALSEGRPRDAAAMLGHWHQIEGPVIRGDQRGRELNFPTANQSIERVHPPRFGVYASQVTVHDGPYAGRYMGATSIGSRPTFGVNTPNCETYLLDFKGDLYGARISVALVDYLRDELKFDGIEALIVQMQADVVRTRHILQNV